MGGLVLVEGVRRPLWPPEVASGVMLAFGIVALAGNAASVWLLRGGQRESLNVRGGNVMNGWAVAVRALQITGHVRAVDRQTLGEENLGPYALARRDMTGQPKTALLRSPAASDYRHDEELDLFVPRITRWHLPLPALVINGLDEIEPRHVVQRLWPDVLVDLAAGGTTSQLILNGPGEVGQCLLRAFAAADTELGYMRRIETATGLRRERFLNEFTVTAKDVAQASVVLRRVRATPERDALS
jgi:hypothetical protein